MEMTAIKPKTKTSLLGKVLLFDEHNYRMHIDAWEEKIIPIVEKIIIEYNELGIGEFSDSVLELVSTRNMGKMTSYYSNAVLEDSRGFKTRSAKLIALSRVEQDLQNISDLFQELKTVIYQFNIKVDWSEVKLIGNTLKVDREKIKKKYQVVIDTEDKATLYKKLETVANAINDLRKYVSKEGYDVERYPLLGERGFIQINNSQEPKIIADSINYIDRLKEFRQWQKEN